VTPGSLLAVVATNVKVATAVVATAAVTAGGGLAVASAVSSGHAGHNVATLAAKPAATHSPGAHGRPATPHVSCPSGLKNHGEFVSSIAKTKPAHGAAANSHGKAVSAAARSNCGKKAHHGGADAADNNDDKNDADSDKATPEATAKP